MPLLSFATFLYFYSVDKIHEAADCYTMASKICNLLLLKSDFVQCHLFHQFHQFHQFHRFHQRWKDETSLGLEHGSEVPMLGKEFWRFCTIAARVRKIAQGFAEGGAMRGFLKDLQESFSPEEDYCQHFSSEALGHHWLAHTNSGPCRAAICA